MKNIVATPTATIARLMIIMLRGDNANDSGIPMSELTSAEHHITEVTKAPLLFDQPKPSDSKKCYKISRDSFQTSVQEKI